MRYLVYARYKGVNSGHKFLSNVVNNKEEGVKLLETLSTCGLVGELVPLATKLKGCETIDEQICRVLQELGVDDSTYERTVKHFSVEIDGDWKHVHAHCDNILKKVFKCNLIREETTCEDGSDCYGAIHTYCL